MEWFDVQPEKSHYVFHDLPVEENPLFAVSANTKYSSSGMVVASCELIYSKSKLKTTVWSSHGL